MSDPARHQRLDELARDLDLVVYRLERDPGSDVERLRAERRAVRRELERLHRELTDLVSGM